MAPYPGVPIAQLPVATVWRTWTRNSGGNLVYTTKGVPATLVSVGSFVTPALLELRPMVWAHPPFRICPAGQRGRQKQWTRLQDHQLTFYGLLTEAPGTGCYASAVLQAVYTPGQSGRPLNAASGAT
ncbi:hypothetical protein PtA15_8A218 [Puccinia triticina]|uniref:Glucose-methanol-choline oxidoreductase N-terminal domain-containing protein n=1 Tax=Puccinia triticina TaxID=208348 RepID=A0ABY7CPY2_9BASI|nr:uncharacterized protein PtA15_8A218 [Puccinia triticina]WAQ87314.1 hypothetical protein PtA15_8A218 [Puccinia triticina]WAR57168.1 hypothetical protein PtB15_8B215 [Puccinia triticina]